MCTLLVKVHIIYHHDHTNYDHSAGFIGRISSIPIGKVGLGSGGGSGNGKGLGIGKGGSAMNPPDIPLLNYAGLSWRWVQEYISHLKR